MRVLNKSCTGTALAQSQDRAAKATDASRGAQHSMKNVLLGAILITVLGLLPDQFYHLVGYQGGTITTAVLFCMGLLLMATM